MTPITLIVVVVLCIVLVWLSERLPAPWGMVVIAAAAIAISFVLLRLLGIY